MQLNKYYSAITCMLGAAAAGRNLGGCETMYRSSTRQRLAERDYCMGCFRVAHLKLARE